MKKYNLYAIILVLDDFEILQIAGRDSNIILLFIYLFNKFIYISYKSTLLFHCFNSFNSIFSLSSCDLSGSNKFK